MSLVECFITSDNFFQPLKDLTVTFVRKHSNNEITNEAHRDNSRCDLNLKDLNVTFARKHSNRKIAKEAQGNS